jgi:hypothetical protein
MALHFIKLSLGTEVCLDDDTGYLWFSGKDFYKYHYVASDVADIFALLMLCSDAVERAAEKERTLHRNDYVKIWRYHSSVKEMWKLMPVKIKRNTSLIAFIVNRGYVTLAQRW